MRLSLGWRMWPGLVFGITALVMLGTALFIGSVFQHVATFPTVHLPYPGAILRTQSMGHWQVARQYQVLAPYREVVAWYQGKDSLSPLPARLGLGCFYQSFRRSSALFGSLLRSEVEEQVTVCSSASGVTITSITIIQVPELVP